MDEPFVGAARYIARFQSGGAVTRADPRFHRASRHATDAAATTGSSATTIGRPPGKPEWIAMLERRLGGSAAPLHEPDSDAIALRPVFQNGYHEAKTVTG
jgi:hypothetical protein